MAKDHFKQIAGSLSLTALMLVAPTVAAQDETEDSSEEQAVVIVQEKSDETKVHEFEIIVHEGDEREHGSRHEELEARVEALRARLAERGAIEAEAATAKVRAEMNLIIRELEHELDREFDALDGDEIAAHIAIQQGIDTDLDFPREIEPEVMVVGVIDQKFLADWLSYKVEKDMMESELEKLIPIFAIIAIFGGPVVVILGIAILRYFRRKSAINAVKELSIASPDLPEEKLEQVRQMLLDKPAAKESKSVVGGRTDLRRGALFTAIGGALTIGFLFSGAWDAMWLGLVMLAYGGARLWLYKKDPGEASEA